MLEITRLLAKQWRAVLKKLFVRHKPVLSLTAGPEGLRMRAQIHQQAIEYHDPAPRAAEALQLELSALDDFVGAKPEPVRLHLVQPQVVSATWLDRGSERSLQYREPESPPNFPAASTEYAACGPDLLAALQQAVQAADLSSSRYALHCIQLRGETGQIIGTDGRQLLVQAGFRLGFPGDPLIPRSDVFACPELQHDAVQLGATETHVVLVCGHWKLWLPIEKEARFPVIDHLLPNPQAAATTLELHPADAKFLTENAFRLPSAAGRQAVTLDLNGQVVIRAADEQERTAELVLRNSRKLGADRIVNLDRNNLVRAARLGLPRIYLFGPNTALVGQDDRRSYIFMPLDEQAAVTASADSVRIESPPCHSPSPTPVRKAITMQRTPAPSSREPAPPANAAEPSPKPARRRKSVGQAGALEQAIALRDQLRTLLPAVRDLIQSLKAERRGRKSLQLALHSLKQLQAA